MLSEFELLAMCSKSRKYRSCCFFARWQCGSGQNAADNHARIHVPWLRVQANLDGYIVRTRSCQRLIELGKRPCRVRACRLKEHLELTWAFDREFGRLAL